MRELSTPIHFILTYLLLFGLIFAVVPFGQSPYETPKAIGAFIFIAAVFLVSLFLLPRKLFIRSLRFNNKKIAVSLCLLGLASYHLFSSNFSSQLLLGNPIRPQGTLLYLSLFLLFFIAPKLPFRLSLAGKWALFSLATLLVFTLIIGPRESFRFIGPLGEPNALGAAVLFLFPLAVSLRDKPWKASALIFATILIFLSGSRSAIFGLLGELLILYLPKRLKVFLPAALVLTITYLVFLAVPFFLHYQPPEYFLRFEDRAEIWSVSALAGFNSPLLGTGFGSSEDVIRKQAERMNSLVQYQLVDHTHNLFLNWWLMGGLIGVILLSTLIAISLKNLYLQRSWSLLAILFGLLVIQSFNPVSSISLIHFWWLLGISFQRKKMDS